MRSRALDGWMGSGGSSIAEFKASVPILKQALEAAGRDPAKFPVSKRVFMAVDERPAVARRELERWFTDVYHNPPGTDASGIHGTPEQVREGGDQPAGKVRPNTLDHTGAEVALDALDRGGDAPKARLADAVEDLEVRPCLLDLVRDVGISRNERPRRSRRVTRRASPSPRTDSTFCSSVRPSRLVPLAFSSKTTPTPARFRAWRWTLRSWSIVDTLA